MITVMTTVRRDGREIDLAVGELAPGLIEAHETTGDLWRGTFTREERVSVQDCLDRERLLRTALRMRELDPEPRVVPSITHERIAAFPVAMQFALFGMAVVPSELFRAGADADLVETGLAREPRRPRTALGSGVVR